MRPRLEREWKQFASFVEEHKIGTIDVQQCEVTYINDLLQGAGWQTFQESVELFAPWWKPGTDRFLPNPETLNINASFEIPERQGRLHIGAQHVRRQIDGRQAIRLQLVARGRPTSGADSDILAWMDLGHEWVVRGFADVTSPRAHKLWNRKS
jgi:hypothetical protein